MATLFAVEDVPNCLEVRRITALLALVVDIERSFFAFFWSSGSFEDTDGLLSKDATASKQCQKHFTNHSVMDFSKIRQYV